MDFLLGLSNILAESIGELARPIFVFLLVVFSSVFVIETLRRQYVKRHRVQYLIPMLGSERQTIVTRLAQAIRRKLFEIIEYVGNVDLKKT
jgi:hypothetical protein